MNMKMSIWSRLGSCVSDFYAFGMWLDMALKRVAGAAISSWASSVKKLSDIPVIVNGNAILEAINGLGNWPWKLNESIVSSSYHSLLPLSHLAALCNNANRNNSSCQTFTSNITPLINAATGEAVLNYPVTIATFQTINDYNIRNQLYLGGSRSAYCRVYHKVHCNGANTHSGSSWCCITIVHNAGSCHEWHVSRIRK